MKKHAKLATNIALTFLRRAGTPDHFSSINFDGNIQTGIARVSLVSEEKIDTDFISDMMDYIMDMKNLWEEELSISLHVDKESKIVSLTTTSK